MSVAIITILYLAACWMMQSKKKIELVVIDRSMTIQEVKADMQRLMVESEEFRDMVNKLRRG